jgi:hypothetical protein
MGKGRGKLAGYYYRILAGSILFEFNIYDRVLLSRLYKQLQSHFSSELQLIYSNNYSIKYLGFGSNFSRFYSRSNIMLFNFRRLRVYDYFTNLNKLRSIAQY